MQIHELSRRRRADEGVGSWIANKAVGVTKAAGSALGAATGLTTPNAQAASAGILDKDAKLAAVRDNSDMQRVAKQLAAGWTAEAAKLVKAAPAAAATPQPATPATPAATPPKPKAPPGFNAANVMKMPGMPGQSTTPGAITPPATKPLPEAVAASPRFKSVVQTKTDEKRVLGEKPTIPAATTPTKPGTPPGFNAANVMKMPGMPGQPPIPGAITPGAAKSGPAAPPAATPPIRGGAGAFDDMTNRLAKGGAGQPDAETPPAETPPAGSTEDAYWKQFLIYVNKKTAIRDASTYQMIGLKQIQDQSGFKNELDAAKAKILQAYKAGQDVTSAATEYILIAMAGAQLISSKNRAGQELEQPEVDPNNPDAAAGATGADGAAADGAAADGAAPGAAPIAGGKILDIAGVQSVFKDYGVDPAMLSKLGIALQRASGTNAVTKTGNGTVDNMLKALGFKVT